MMQAGRERFAHFLLQDRVIRTIPIRDLANAVSEVDPMGIVDFSVQVPNALSDWLRTGGKAALRETGVETIPTRFIGPRAPRATSKRSYVVDGGNPVRVAADYSEALHHHQMMEAERDELKGRMRAWMTHAGVSRWGPFEIGQGSPKLTADVRIVAEWLRAEGSPTTGLPARFLVGFSDSQLLALSKYVDSNSTPVLRWRPNGNALTIDVVQSRDWYDDDDGP
jgi:hypothetical protein